jgi:Ca2+-binding EF-hand superfamily protein
MKMRMPRTRSTFIAALLTGLGCTSMALAADTKPANFEALDKDADGKISINEATEHDALFVAFKRLDTDKDGSLTKEEFAAYRAEN